MFFMISNLYCCYFSLQQTFKTGIACAPVGHACVPPWLVL